MHRKSLIFTSLDLLLHTQKYLDIRCSFEVVVEHNFLFILFSL